MNQRHALAVADKWTRGFAPTSEAGPTQRTEGIRNSRSMNIIGECGRYERLEDDEIWQTLEISKWRIALCVDYIPMALSPVTHSQESGSCRAIGWSRLRPLLRQ